MNSLLSLNKFGEEERYHRLPSGSYKVIYNDITHLDPDDWRDLLDINLFESAASGTDSERSFSLNLSLDAKFSAIEKTKNRNLHVLRDTISLSATRIGLLPPLISGVTADQLFDLKKDKGIVLIPDSNSLYNGTLHWLLNVLRNSTLWMLPFVMSLTQIQSRDAALKAMSRQKKDANLGQALRSRAFVNAGLGLLERNHHRYQVLELDPSLLRYMKMPDKNGFDTDDSEVLEDRLLIEGVHSILRSTRTRARQVVVTSDVLLSRILSTEGIANLCLPTPTISDESLPNVRYDAWSQTYVGTTLRGLLWDLAHSFGSVRLKRNDDDYLQLSCYWPGKLPNDWHGEQLDVCWQTKEAEDKQPAEEEGAAPAPVAKTPSKVRIARLSEREDNPSNVVTSKVETLSDAVIPQSSLLLALKLAGAVYSLGKGTVEEILSSIPEEERPAPGNATRALEVLRRAQIINFENSIVTATKSLDSIDSSLRNGDLDSISSQFLNYEPYKIILNKFEENESIDRKDVNSILEAELRAKVAREASVRLVRYHVLLGQVWTDEGIWRDGSNRPEQGVFLTAFSEVFNEISHDNIAKFSDFLPIFCRRMRMSPWSVAKATQNYARPLSAEYSLQYAVGGKPSGTDHILAGSLLDLEERVVPMDRIEIGGRPVLTLGRIK